ncbi:MAG: hypothetical protein ACXAC5_01435 [Promethearchaeota archaeon]
MNLALTFPAESVGLQKICRNSNAPKQRAIVALRIPGNGLDNESESITIFHVGALVWLNSNVRSVRGVLTQNKVCVCIISANIPSQAKVGAQASTNASLPMVAVPSKTN